MTKHEFEEWIDYHCCAFPKLREDFETNTRNLGQWYNALKRVRLKAAKEATDEMLGDGVKFGEHVSVVKTYAKNNRGIEGEAEAPRKLWDEDGQRIYTCWRCKDSGHRYVFGPKPMASMKKGPSVWYFRPTDYVICACDCDWGKKVGYSQRLVPFDRTKHVDWEGDDRDALARLAQFYGVSTPATFVDRYERPKHVKPVVEQATTAPKPLASLVASPKSIVAVAASADDGRVYDESEAATEGPWTPEMDIPF